MRMISKNNNGVTLVALVITIVVLMIIIGITLNYGVTELHNVADKKTESELGIVQEAVMQRYALVKSSSQTGIKAPAISSNTTFDSDTGRPTGMLGTRIAKSEDITTTYGFSEVTLKSNYSSGEANKVFEEFYYLLNEDDINDLGIEKGDRTRISDEIAEKDVSYIVNYSTGEVFDIANKKYYNSDDYVYKQPTDLTMENKTYNFNDD